MNDDEWLCGPPWTAEPVQTDNQLKYKETWSPLQNLEWINYVLSLKYISSFAFKTVEQVVSGAGGG